MAQESISKGQLQRALEDWCPTFQGYHIYYASHRQASSAFALLIDAYAINETPNVCLWPKFDCSSLETEQSYADILNVRN